jgi:hypothetical protein
METTTILDNSATPDNGLLARLQQHTNFTPGKYDPAALRARIAAEIASARAAPWECGPAPARYDTGDDDGELVEHVPVPARRQRKRSLASTLKAARKVGADRVIVDGVVIALSPAAAVSESVSLTDSNTNEWDAVLEVDHAPH